MARRKPRTLAVKPKPDGRICRLIEDGRPCRLPVTRRGMCGGHWQYCQRHGLLDKYGAPKVKRGFEIALNANAVEGTCKILESGRPCAGKATRTGLCTRHYSLISKRKNLDIRDFAPPLVGKPPKTLQVKPRIKEGVCRLIADGKPCEKPVLQRGLCRSHHQFCRTRGLLGQYAAPHSRLPSKYAVNPDPDPGMCRLLIEGVPCSRKAGRSGLCTAHYGLFRKSKNIRLEDFCEPLKWKPPTNLRVNPKPRRGICRLFDDGEACTRQAFQRGLCHRHWHHCQKRGLLDQFGAPKSYRAERFTVDPVPKRGVCRILVLGRPCGLKASIRGLCRKHYSMLKSRRDVNIEDYCEPRRKQNLDGLRVKVMPDEGVCRLITAEGPCLGRVRHRGLCRTHYELCSSHGVLDDYAEPVEIRRTRLGVKAKPVEGVCRIVADGKPCRRKPKLRGVCRAHYIMIQKRADLAFDDLCLPAQKPIWERAEKRKIKRLDVCNLVVDGEPCEQGNDMRGLCEHHYYLLRKSPGGIEEWAAWPRKHRMRYAVKKNPEPGKCRITESDGRTAHPTPCAGEIFRRGLCRRHYHAISRRGELQRFGMDGRSKGGRPR